MATLPGDSRELRTGIRLGTALQEHRATPGGDSCPSNTAQPCQERSHRVGKEPVSLGRSPFPPVPVPRSRVDRTTELLAARGCSHHPSWLTPGWFPSRLSPFSDSSVVSPPHLQHAGSPGCGSAAGKSLARGSHLLRAGLLGWLCSAPLARLGTHPSLAGQWHKLPHVPCSSKPKEKPHHFPSHLPARAACSTGRLGTGMSSQMPAHPVPSRASSGPCRDQVGTAQVTARLSCAHASPAAGPAASSANAIAGEEKDGKGIES